jgi:hypothetical protein
MSYNLNIAHAKLVAIHNAVDEIMSLPLSLNDITERLTVIQKLSEEAIKRVRAEGEQHDKAKTAS